jgi:prepilin-type N-terminal cleavage/methylation domain-containing protein
MMLVRRQAGFTLIEIILVMVISSMLAIIALTGFSALRGQAQFSDSIERLKEKVVSLRQEALSTIKLSGGADATHVTFGRLLTFTPGSSTVQVQTLETANNPAPVAGQAVVTVPAEDTSFAVAWGVTFTGPRVTQVAFVRSTVDGALQTAVSTAWVPGSYKYSDFAPNGAPANLNFRDPTGRTAFLTVTPANDGVTRTFP